MNWKEFTKNALRTESQEQLPNKDTPVDTAYVFYLIQMQVKQSHILGLLKKRLFYGENPKFDFPKEMHKALRDQRDLAKEVFEYFLNDRDSGFYYSKDEAVMINPRVLHAAIGLATESGELLEKCLEIVTRDDSGVITESDKLNLCEEGSDLSWYQAVLFDALGVDKEQSDERVIEKLRVRFSDKFTSEAAHSRDLAAEYAALEGK